MISIIICSRKSDISQTFKENIAKTIEVVYELVIIDNSKNKYSIFQAYNLGVSRAKYPYLCFMHDDILFHTEDWGEKVIKHFENPEIGIIGVAGGHYMPDTPSSWANSQVNSLNILQSSFENGLKIINPIIELDFLKDKLSIEVVAVDGVWFCAKKSLFNNISFDENTFNGFHCYDLDICFQARNAGYLVLVISDISLEHLSGGNWNTEWVKNTLVFYHKWKAILPQIAGVELTPEEIKSREAFVSDIFSLLKELSRLKSEIKRIQSSKAYRIGKFILRPFAVFRNKIKGQH